MNPLPTALNLLIPPVAPSDYQYFSTVAQRPQFVPDATVLSWVNAWWLAECSLLAYCDAGSAKEPLDHVGLKAEFVEVDTNQAYVIWDEQKVIVAFRGTDFPTVKSLTALADSMLDWSRDLDAGLERWPSLGRMYTFILDSFTPHRRCFRKFSRASRP